MPRGERPLDDGDSPLLLFAADLRRLRTNAGLPSYRELSRRAHFSASTLSEAAGGRKLPGLDATLAYVRGCHGDESAWEQRWHDVAVAMAQSRSANDGPSPYVGLNPFTREDADRFFGREALTHTLLDRLERQRFLAVFGASGEGKSSLLRAGLAAKFERSVICTPGHDPDAAIAEALDRHPDLLVVDQFEELFTLCDDEVQRAAFLDALLSADCRRVIAIRSDFYPNCAQYPKLADALTDAQVLLGTMTPDELRRAITQPAATVGCTVETALLTTLVAEAAGRSGVLPLVSHALLETWHRRRGNTLTLTGYQAAGGIQGALAQSAEAAYASLDEDQQRLAKQLLLRLSIDGTKRPIPRQDVVGEEVLDVLAETRLITVDEHTVEVTHEALFLAWPRLRAWLDEDHEGLRTHRRLTDAARTWQELGRDTDSLYRTGRLAETTEWIARATPELTATESEFIGASKARERRRSRRVRWIAAGLTALLVATTATAVVAVRQRREVDRLELVRKSQELTAQSEALAGSDPKRAGQLAAEAYQAYPTPEARGRVFSAAAAGVRNRTLTLADAGMGRTLDVKDMWAFDLGSGTTISLSSGLGIQQYNAVSLEPIRWIPSGDETSYVFSWDQAPDGRIVMSLGNGRVLLWPAPDARPVELTRTRSPVGTAFTADGHSLLVGGTMWDLDTRQPRFELPVGAITGPFTLQGDTLALASNGSVALWNLTSRQRTGGFVVGSGEITRLKLLPGGKIALVATNDGVVQLRDIASGAVTSTLPTHSGAAMSLNLKDDGSVLVSAGLDGQVHLWDMARGSLIATLAVGEPVFSTQFAADGSLVLLTEHALRFWPARNVPMTSGRAVRALGVDSDGVVVTLDDAGVLERRDSSLRLVHQVDTGVVQRASGRFSPDLKQVVTGAPLSVRDADTGRPVTTLDTLGFPADGRPPVAMAFDGKALLTVGGDVPDGVWHVGDKSPPQLIGGLSWGARTSATFGKDEHEIVMGRDDGNVSVRSTTTFDETAFQSPHKRPVRAMAVSPDKKMLATGDDDGLIALWDTATWRQVGELRGHTQAVTALEFSPDSSRLASGGRDQDVIVWDVASRTLWAALRGHTQAVTHLAWRPDGSTVVSAGTDSLSVWGLGVDQALDAIR
ncbi:AAA family ATPase [Lentzea sp. NPDC006480]|uniref:AAA family ATPase n=1 Tax=Lentzea sp. NPDC006480 TaxID=3157176 RepID=UPI00339FF0F6